MGAAVNIFNPSPKCFLCVESLKYYYVINKFWTSMNKDVNLPHPFVGSSFGTLLRRKCEAFNYFWHLELALVQYLLQVTMQSLACNTYSCCIKIFLNEVCFFHDESSQIVFDYPIKSHGNLNKRSLKRERGRLERLKSESPFLQRTIFIFLSIILFKYQLPFAFDAILFLFKARLQNCIILQGTLLFNRPTYGWCILYWDGSSCLFSGQQTMPLPIFSLSLIFKHLHCPSFAQSQDHTFITGSWPLLKVGLHFILCEYGGSTQPNHHPGNHQTKTIKSLSEKKE